MRAVDRIAVVVPAKDEELLLPACLTALVDAAREVSVPVHILVVLDSCRDKSDLVVLRQTRTARDVELRSTRIDVTCVGAARRHGMAHVLNRFPAETTWLATTDADSAVPRHWFVSQLERQAAGYAVVVGTIEVTDWSEHPAAVPVRAMAEYAAGPHRHVHGTNLAFAGSAYVRAGGFEAVPTDEDVALVAAFEAMGESIAWVADAPVVTSARKVARAPRGFAGYLLDLALPRGDGRAGSAPREASALPVTQGAT